MIRNGNILLGVLVALAASAAALPATGYVEGARVNSIWVPADGRVHEFEVLFVSKEAGYTNEVWIDQPFSQLVWPSCDPSAQPHTGVVPPGEMVFRMKNGQGGDFYSGSKWSQSSDAQPHFVIVLTNLVNPRTYHAYVEDLSGLGDQDYNDCVFKVNIW